jgi:hypothetical protein
MPGGNHMPMTGCVSSGADRFWHASPAYPSQEDLMDNKIDYKIALKDLYSARSDSFGLVDVPPMQFVMVDGEGDPNVSPGYSRAVNWLFTVSHGLKHEVKRKKGHDYVVPPLEGLWWADNPDDFEAGRKDRWRWSMMIMAPDVVCAEMFNAVASKSEMKLGDAPTSLRLDTFHEGLSMQHLHVGTYEAEGPKLNELYSKIMPAQKLIRNGHHHEIYLSDARRTEAKKLRTILRQPVRPNTATQ